MAVMQEKKPDASKFSTLPEVKKDVFRFVCIPHKRFFNLTFSGSQKKVADATEILQACLNAKKEKKRVKDPFFQIARAIGKLEAAVRQGDESDSTLLILGSAYALEGHVAEAQKACLALRENGAHSFENILGAMVAYGFYQALKSNDRMGYGDRIAYLHEGKENEARGKQLLNGSPVPDIALQILEFKKTQTGMFD